MSGDKRGFERGWGSVAFVGALVALTLLGCQRAQPAEELTLEEGSHALLDRHFPEARAQVYGADEAKFSREDRGWVRSTAGALELTLPWTGTDPIKLQIGKMKVEVLELEQAGSGRELGKHAAALAYEAPGRTSFWTARAGGVEHWILLERATEARVTSYRVKGATLRQADEAVELLDGRDRPHVRVTAPEAWAADGKPVTVRLVASADRIDVFAETESEGPILVDPFWEVAGPLTDARAHHGSVVLAGGVVIAAGGQGSAGKVANTESYDPLTNTWSSVGAMVAARSNHTMTRLADGRAVATGGITTVEVASAELFNPVTGMWAATGNMNAARANHTATLLDNGNVFIAGGDARTLGLNLSLNTVETFNGSSFSLVLATMNARRSLHTATKLDTGRVLLVGGTTLAATLASSEVFNPAGLGSFAAGPTMAAARQRHTATQLTDGRVLIVGGTNESGLVAVAETYELNGTFLQTGSLRYPRADHTATLLPDGRVLIAGGGDPLRTPAEVYDPATGEFTGGGCIANARSFHTAELISDDPARVLILGGINGTPLASTELFDPAGGLAIGIACVSDCDCLSGFCSDGFCCDGECGGGCDFCDGRLTGTTAGNCALEADGAPGEAPVCAPYLCDGTGAVCPSTCVDDTDCVSSHFCNTTTSTCLPRNPNGTPCTDQDECASRQCVDGFCCNSACEGGCNFCNLPTNEGTCMPLQPGQQPSPSCAPFVCTGGSHCPTSCTEDSECALGNFCDGNTCVPKLPNGNPCLRDGYCISDACSDGICCENRCEGSCNACNSEGALGVCTILSEGSAGSPSCAPYTCSGGIECKSSCDADEDCAEGFRCENNVCVEGVRRGYLGYSYGCNSAGPASGGWLFGVALLLAALFRRGLRPGSVIPPGGTLAGSARALTLTLVLAAAVALPSTASAQASTTAPPPGESTTSAEPTKSTKKQKKKKTKQDAEASGETATAAQGTTTAPKTTSAQDKSSAPSTTTAQGTTTAPKTTSAQDKSSAPSTTTEQGTTTAPSEKAPEAKSKKKRGKRSAAEAKAAADAATKAEAEAARAEAAAKKAAEEAAQAAAEAERASTEAAERAAAEASQKAAAAEAESRRAISAQSESAEGDAKARVSDAVGGFNTGESSVRQVRDEEMVAERDFNAPGALGRLHLGLSLVNEFVARQAGLEVQASYSVAEWLDLGAGAAVGDRLGARATATLHFPREEAATISPFLQIRALVHPVFGGTGVGGGAWAGGQMELGPGRIRAGVLGEGYSGPSNYYPYAVAASIGYELDPFRSFVEVRERIVERVIEREQPTTGGLRGKVTDLDDNPLEGKVVLKGPNGKTRDLPAAPDFSVELEPGTYEATASAEGYLARGRTFRLQAGETLITDFQLREVPETPTAILTEERIEITQTILFEFGAARILPESFNILDEVVDILLRNPTLKIRIEGHTDNIGPADFNQKLSQNRTESVRAYLIEKGIAPARLTAQGFGLSQPIAPNNTEAGRAKNRRVEFKLTER